MVASKRLQRPSLRPPRSVLAQVRRCLREHSLLQPGVGLLAAVSGGPDSTCLLLALAALRQTLRFDLSVAYLDHGLRSAGREAKAVRSLADALDVPFFGGASDVRKHARAERLSIEEAARELRYRFLAEAAERAGCGTVAVGHTRDDQVETVLLHLLRGSGLRGLAAMARSSPWPVPIAGKSPRLVRPLLGLSRTETEACCEATGVDPVEDPTNRSLAHLRNRIRLELLPVLREYNPRVDEALVRLADAAAGDIELLERMAAEAALEDPGAEPGVVRLDRKALLALPDALQRHAVRHAVARVAGDGRRLSERNVRSLLGASEGPTGSSLDFPRGVHVEVQRRIVVLSTGRPPPPTPLPAEGIALAVPGSTRFGPWHVEASLLSRRPRDLSSGGTCSALLDFDACGAQLQLRRRHPGDRFHPLGLAAPKKLQDFFVDAHVPRSERDAVPLLCSERGIAWVAGQRPAEWAKVTPSTQRVLRVRARRTP